MLPFPFNLYAAALVGAAVVAFVSLPAWRRLCVRWNLVDDPGHRKIHLTPTPLAGGLAVLTGLLVPLIAGVVAVEAGWIGHVGQPLLSHGLERRGLQLASIAVGALGMFGLGLADDRHELKAGPKFIGQLAVAGLVAAAGVRVALFSSVALNVGVTLFWILAVINAFNFMDNMNGLCSGLGAIGGGCFLLWSAAHGHYLDALLAGLVAGALIGFLPHNFPKAKAFLGDSGSHVIGFLMAALALLPQLRPTPNAWMVWSPLLFLALPLADMVCVVVIRTLAGKAFYIGDTNHLSHRLERWGMSRVRAVLVIWLLAMGAGALPFLFGN